MLRPAAFSGCGHKGSSGGPWWAARLPCSAASARVLLQLRGMYNAYPLCVFGQAGMKQQRTASCHETECWRGSTQACQELTAPVDQ